MIAKFNFHSHFDFAIRIASNVSVGELVDFVPFYNFKAHLPIKDPVVRGIHTIMAVFDIEMDVLNICTPFA